MDDTKKRQVMIAIIALCLVVAVVITLSFNNPFSSGSAGASGPMQMLCVNPDCGYAFEISRDEFRKQMMEKGPMGPMMMGPMAAPPAFTCPKCGEESAYMAAKCPKCEHVFINDYSISDDYPDRCPECGYSAMEERHNKSKKAK
jgi:ssDNA-binding Zn-finger/Zn-ribbon topoisomerase 1